MSKRYYLTYEELIRNAMKVDELVGKNLREEYFMTYERTNPTSRFYKPKWDKEVREILDSDPNSEVSENHKHLVKNKLCLLDLGIIARALVDADSQ